MSPSTVSPNVLKMPANSALKAVGKTSPYDLVRLVRNESLTAKPQKDPDQRLAAPNLKAIRESWQLQTAKAGFSEVFRRARAEGPQRVTRQGRDGVVMLAEEQYDQLVGKSHQPKSLVRFFRESPLVGVDLDLDRDPDPGRDVDL